MGKKNKAMLNSQENVEIVPATASPADDDSFIPYHTKQATFALLLLLFFSILMFTFPIAAFYGTRYALHEYLQVDGFPNTCWSVLASVATVNIVIALYAIVGYIEARKEERLVNGHAQQSKEKIN